MNTRAKFQCVSVKKVVGWGGADFLFESELNAVTGDVRETPEDRAEVNENRSFFAATPFGKITLGSVRSDLFEVGRIYYVDFTPVS